MFLPNYSSNGYYQYYSHPAASGEIPFFAKSKKELKQCPSCGEYACEYIGLNFVECKNQNCQWFKRD